jgi:fructose-1,6-bisphosphatase I
VKSLFFLNRLDDFLDKATGADISKIIQTISATSVSVWQELPLSSGREGGVNPSGDRQTEIDVFANGAFVSALLKTGAVAEIASEELEAPAKGEGPLHVTMDPLDGSSNISTNNVLGSIFGIYDEALPCAGDHIVSSAYVTYGPMLTITISLGRGVQRFVAIEGPSGWSFELTDASISVPQQAEVFGLGGLRKDWIPAVETFAASLERRGTKLRYGGTFVGDYNQVLRHGGIFGYPALKGRPRGKLRLLYEAAPMSFITERAGGAASDGSERILSLRPAELAETTPIYLGTPSLVRELEGLIRAGR